MVDSLHRAIKERQFNIGATISGEVSWTKEICSCQNLPQILRRGPSIQDVTRVVISDLHTGKTLLKDAPGLDNLTDDWFDTIDSETQLLTGRDIRIDVPELRLEPPALSCFAGRAQ